MRETFHCIMDNFFNITSWIHVYFIPTVQIDMLCEVNRVLHTGMAAINITQETKGESSIIVSKMNTSNSV